MCRWFYRYFFPQRVNFDSFWVNYYYYYFFFISPWASSRKACKERSGPSDWYLQYFSPRRENLFVIESITAQDAECALDQARKPEAATPAPATSSRLREFRAEFFCHRRVAAAYFRRDKTTRNDSSCNAGNEPSLRHGSFSLSQNLEYIFFFSFFLRLVIRRARVLYVKIPLSFILIGRPHAGIDNSNFMT